MAHNEEALEFTSRSYIANVVAPDWDYLRIDYGPHYIFGNCVGMVDGWTSLDLKNDPPFDIVKDPFTFSEVSVIHCVSILYHWDYIEVIKVLKKSFDALKKGGVMYLSEVSRDVDAWPYTNIKSMHTNNSLSRLLYLTGFDKVHRDNSHRIAGRGNRPSFALRATKGTK